MINFNDFNNVFQQANDESLPAMLDKLCQRVTGRIQAERDSNAMAHKTHHNGTWHVVIEHSRGKDLYAIIGQKGAYDFMRVFVV